MMFSKKIIGVFFMINKLKLFLVFILFKFRKFYSLNILNIINIPDFVRFSNYPFLRFVYLSQNYGLLHPEV